jgi:hypothetical protein
VAGCRDARRRRRRSPALLLLQGGKAAVIHKYSFATDPTGGRGRVQPLGAVCAASQYAASSLFACQQQARRCVRLGVGVTCCRRQKGSTTQVGRAVRLVLQGEMGRTRLAEMAAWTDKQGGKAAVIHKFSFATDPTGGRGRVQPSGAVCAASQYAASSLFACNNRPGGASDLGWMSPAGSQFNSF